MKYNRLIKLKIILFILSFKVAKAVLFLASEDSSFTTGELLHVVSKKFKLKNVQILIYF
jgi:hypothetical protein